MEANKEKNELSAKELESVSGGFEEQLEGIPMKELISTPLEAAAKAAEQLKSSLKDRKPVEFGQQ
ncbi:bacteriocin [Treponema sp. C6A8]|uniref:bacteriocin n=1 Tax=Treponema sp. C6A8 TaxID=1410609 RepID=UPI0004883EE2|nr:bacteriocin [Treponema sp. C6A8]